MLWGSPHSISAVIQNYLWYIEIVFLLMSHQYKWTVHFKSIKGTVHPNYKIILKIYTNKNIITPISTLWFTWRYVHDYYSILATLWLRTSMPHFLMPIYKHCWVHSYMFSHAVSLLWCRTKSFPFSLLWTSYKNSTFRNLSKVRFTQITERHIFSIRKAKPTPAVFIWTISLWMSFFKAVSTTNEIPFTLQNSKPGYIISKQSAWLEITTCIQENHLWKNKNS